MAWIESHQALGRHPKLLKLAGALRVHRAQALGHLHYLWWWALDYAPTGDVSALSSAEIAAAAEWSGDVEKIAQALRESGWLDPDGTIHNWMLYAGKLIEQRQNEREKTRERVREYRERRNARVTPLHGPCNGGTVPNPTVPTVQTQPKTVCAEPQAAPGAVIHPLKAILAFPVVGKPGGGTWELTEGKVSEYKESYPGLDVLNECRKALQWVRDRPNRRKTPRGMPAFLSSWLGRAQNWARGENRAGPRGGPDGRTAGEAAPTPGKYAHLS